MRRISSEIVIPGRHINLALGACLLLATACGAGDIKNGESSRLDGSTPSGDGDGDGSGSGDGDHASRDAGHGGGSHHNDAGASGDGDVGGDGDGDTSNTDQDAGHPSAADSFFISVTGGAKIVRSDDGAAWEVVADTYDGTAGWGPAYDSENLYRGACSGRLPSGDPLVLAVGGGAAYSAEAKAVGQTPARISRSTDGKTWTHTVSVNGAADAVLLNLNWLGGCAFGNGIVVTTGAFYSLTSTDGHNWQKHRPTVQGVEFYARSMTFGSGLFVAAGDHGIYVSSNGVDWELVSNQHANRIYFHGGVFLASWEGDAGYQRSTDGRTWEALSAPNKINRFSHDGKRFIASSGENMGPLLISEDGKSFTAHLNKGYDSLTGIAFGKGTYVSLAGVNSALYFRGDVTADGSIAWQKASIPGDAEGPGSTSIWFVSF